MKTNVWMALACATLLAACANETRDPGPCDGDLIAYQSADWCIVIEEGFLTSDCPDAYPEGRAFDDVVVCGQEVAPDEMREELEERAYIGPRVCEDDAERGLTYTTFDADCSAAAVACPEGSAAFKDECGCGCEDQTCEEGARRNDDCNECVCEGGEWACTMRGCGECTVGDRRNDGCNECVCEAGGWVCTAMDCPSCEEGERRMEDCNECVCTDGEWACTRRACECEEGETMTVDCNSCTCREGSWECTTAACFECEPGDTRWVGCEYEVCEAGFWALSGVDEACEYEACVDACPASCVGNADQPCGDDLAFHCTECHMACADVEPIDRSYCEDPIQVCMSDTLEVTNVEWSVWTPTEGCYFSEWELWEDKVFTSDGELGTEYGCELPTGIDWDANVLVRVMAMERVEATVTRVYDSGTALQVDVAAPAYCGGAAPPNTPVHLLVPTGTSTTIDKTPCTYGRCVGPPAP